MSKAPSRENIIKAFNQALAYCDELGQVPAFATLHFGSGTVSIETIPGANKVPGGERDPGTVTANGKNPAHVQWMGIKR